MDSPIEQQFQILALSGGGYRGLFTAKILADVEREIGEPIARRFDLIAGTSIGGILALALALEIPASTMVDLFVEHGERIFKPRFTMRSILRAKYSSDYLAQLLQREDLFAQKVLGDCLHPVIIPAINYTRGQPVLFKTPHHETFKRDHRYRIVDVGMATSAAPTFFPRYVFENCQYVDGGLFANAPGLLGLHEAQKFFGFLGAHQNVKLLSIGTMSSKFTVDPNRNRQGGLLDWGGLNPAATPERLFGLSISAQESMANFMLGHLLPPENYLHVDDVLTDERARAVALDRVDAAAREVLLGSASEESKNLVGNAKFTAFMRHRPAAPVFFYGPNSIAKETV
ncbi:CBASS cGAMP-activated phospholipase [Paraburkholderia pallida]|uniref:Patatin n=1 Tax=Paraburkholderia pallida TaxID=2547399 RepID=A0A4P7D3G8_9BURK|nr:CBASS cGAMP-activated phospholipase [Paraburkholderia pallida]QBR02498.1 patatin [Paraburkholderia pallida]